MSGSEGRARLARLFLVSAAALYLEMLLIRWIGTEVRIFAYIQNAILVVCFMGMGLGCLDAARPFRLRDVLLPLGVLLAAFAAGPSRAILSTVSNMLAGTQDLVIWYQQGSSGHATAFLVLGLVVVAVLVMLVWATFVPLGRLVGRLLADHPRPLAAYATNIAGSILGVWLFVALGALCAPPPVWFALAVLLLFPLVGSALRERLVAGLVSAAVVGLSFLAARDPGSVPGER